MTDSPEDRFVVCSRKCGPAALSTAVRSLAVTLVLAMALALGPFVHQAAAQQSDGAQRIAAVVNEDAISLYDLTARMEIIMKTAGMPNLDEVRQRLAPQVLRTLIDEALKNQEAERVGVTVENQDLAEAVGRVENRNGMQPGQLNDVFKAGGLDWNSFVAQMRSEIGWAKAVRRSLRSRVSVSEDEINLYLNRLRQNIGKPEYLVAEIFLPVDEPSQDAEVLGVAQRLTDQMRRGANFAALAQQFSRSPSAANSGDLGWVGPGDVDPEVLDALAQMEPGNLSTPVRTFGGYYILLLRDKRLATAGDAAGPLMSRLILPTSGPQAMPAETLNSIRSVLADGVQGCEALNELAATTGAPNSGTMGRVDIARLPPDAAQYARTLPVGSLSPAMSVQGSEVYLMVCDRSTDGMPPRGVIEERLMEQKLQNAAQRRLRDLRQQAIIDIRI